MAVPSRAFVAVVVFGLITVLVTLPVTILLLGAYSPAPTAPWQLAAPQEDTNWGPRIFFSLATVLSFVLLGVSWRALLQGARRDAARRKRREELKEQLREYQAVVKRNQ